MVWAIAGSVQALSLQNEIPVGWVVKVTVTGAVAATGMLAALRSPTVTGPAHEPGAAVMGLVLNASAVAPLAQMPCEAQAASRQPAWPLQSVSAEEVQLWVAP